MKYLIATLLLLVSFYTQAQNNEKYNIVFILADDMGYADLGCYGAPQIKTPVADKMAKEGTKFTSFYTQPVCGPTRTSILSGSYSMRVAEFGNKKRHHPFVHTKEILIPKVLQPEGYVSACIGKWDLNGHKKTYINKITPNDFGFDYSYGRPSKGEIYENGKFVKKAKTSLLTKWYTDATINFIEKNKDKPFFVYLAHTMPHVPLDASPQFKGKSKGGLYGDVIEELDWSLGRVLDKIKALGLDKKTIVIYTSDNGPWPKWTGPELSGSAVPLRGQKCETWEGGVRVPFIVRAPGIIPKNKTCEGIIGDVDMLPTFAAIAKAKIPKDRIIDGKNIFPLMTGKVKKSPVTTRYYYYDSHLQAVRYKNWKLILKRPMCPPWLQDKGLAKNYRGVDVEEIKEPQLYNLKKDIGETTDVASTYPKVVEKLLKIAEVAKSDIGNYNQIGKGARFFDKASKRPEVKKWENYNIDKE